MGRIARLWLVYTAATFAILAAVGWCCGHANASEFAKMGFVVSLVTVLGAYATVAVSGLAASPLHRMLIETCVRMAIPLGFLLALVITRPGLQTDTFLLYFLPFQFVNLFVMVMAAVGEIEVSPSHRSSLDA